MSMKKSHKNSLVTAPNSIDYIVLSNPQPIRKMLYAQGYEVPNSIKGLVSAIKALIKQKGQPIVTALLAHHPDKKALLSLQHSGTTQCNACNHDGYNTEANLCRQCGHSNYNGSGDEDAFLDQFTDASNQQVKAYYDRIVKKSNANPEDQALANEVQLVWNELRQRKLLNKQEETPDAFTKYSSLKDELLMLTVVFIAGYLVGNKLNS